MKLGDFIIFYQNLWFRKFLTSFQRTQAAQQRKEDKKKAEKEKLMAENDPEKARKYEVCFFIRVVSCN